MPKPPMTLGDMRAYIQRDIHRTIIIGQSSKRRTHFMAIIVRTAELSQQPTGKLPVWLMDVEIDGARRSMYVTAPNTTEASKAVAKRLGYPSARPEAVFGSWQNSHTAPNDTPRHASAGRAGVA